jgi:hypothetical protein
MSVRKVTIAEFQAELMAQGVSSTRHLAVVCPMCGTVQSMADLIRAGAGATESEVDRFIGFSCVGRWTGAPAPRAKSDGKPCNWTLGGLFKTHKLAVIDEEGKEHPRFEVASPAQAQAHEKGAAS